MTRQTLVGIVIAVVLVVLSNSLYVIRETQRGVLLKFGEVVDPDLQPGMHIKVPFVNSVRKFDGRILTVDSSPERFFTQEKKALIVDSYAKFASPTRPKYYTATNGEENALLVCSLSESTMACESGGGADGARGGLLDSAIS
jgi:membrane protease subunit HflC